MSKKFFNAAPMGFSATMKFSMDGETTDKLWNAFRRKHVPAGWKLSKRTSGYGEKEVTFCFHTTDREAAVRMTPDDWEGTKAFLSLILKREGT